MNRYSLDRSDWEERPALDLFSAANLATVREAYTRQERTVVFGWHYSFAGGSNRTEVVFTTIGDYLRHIEQARPGDHLTLFDLDRVAHLAFLRLGEVTSTVRMFMTDEENDRVDDQLRRGVDIVAVRRFTGPLTGTTEASLDQLDASDLEEVRATLRRWTWQRGELLLLDEAALDDDGEGGSITAVSPLERTRIHALVDAKRPDPEGRVPLHGPY